MAERKKRFSGLYWQQFALTAGMVMLTLLLLGVSFFALSYNYNFTERRDELQERARLIAQVSVDYLKSGGQTEDENLKRFISLGSAMTNAEFLVCNDSGYALLTADQRLGGKVVAIPQEITQEVLTGSGLYQGRSSLGGAYTSKQFVVGVPVQDGDQTIGVVLAVMNARSVMGMWRSFISLFLMTSAIILLLVFIVTSLTSMRQIQPIREMAKATRRYAEGDFDIRMNDYGRDDELGELAASFNNMAENLQQTERQRREFITNISHELKTPLATMKLLSENVLYQDNPDPAMMKEFFGDVNHEVDRLTRIVTELLRLVQEDTSDGQLNLEKLDLDKLVGSVCTRLDSLARNKNIKLVTDLRTVTMDGDRMRLEQVAVNLVENAIKYTDEGTVCVRVAR